MVLFGYRDNSSRAKDIALAALVRSFCPFLYYYLFHFLFMFISVIMYHLFQLGLLSVVIALMMRQRRRARVEMNSLANQLEELNSMKSHLEDTTEKYVTSYFLYCLGQIGREGKSTPMSQLIGSTTSLASTSIL